MLDTLSMTIGAVFIPAAIMILMGQLFKKGRAKDATLEEPDSPFMN